MQGRIRRIKGRLKHAIGAAPVAVSEVPGHDPIELPAYFEEFVSWYPNCEMATKRWCVEHARPDWVWFDCGANVGLYTILFARLSPAGTVHAFEPTKTFKMLERNLEHAGVGNVVAEACAVGRETGVHDAKIQRVWGHVTDDAPFPFTTIDAYVEACSVERVDCVKIDVDSYELDVLQGAEHTLERFDPFVILELTDEALALRGHSTLDVFAWLARRGYGDGVVLEHGNYLFRRGMNPAEHAAGSRRMVVHLDDRDPR